MIATQALTSTRDIDSPRRGQATLTCASKCCDYILAKAGRGITTNELSRYFPDSNKMYSLEDIRKVLVTHGLHAKGRRLNVSELLIVLQSNISIVVHLDSLHFVGLSAVEEDGEVELFDGTFSRKVPVAHLTQLFKASKVSCLEVSDELMIPRVLSLGSLSLNDERQFIIPVRNDGSRKVALRGIKSTCGCIVSDKHEHASISPGCKYDLSAKLVGTEKAGHFTKRVTLELERENRWEREIIVKYSVKSPISIVPNLLRFTSAETTSDYTASCLIKNETDGLIDQVNIVVGNIQAVCSQPGSIRPGATAAITLRIAYPGFVRRQLDADVFVYRSSKTSKLAVPCIIAPHLSLTVIPEAITFGIKSKRQVVGSITRVNVTAEPGNEIVIKSIKKPFWIDCQYEAKHNKCVVTVTVNSAVADLSGFSVSGSVIVELTHYSGASPARIEIPINGVFTD